jgi:hypothetical protein
MLCFCLIRIILLKEICACSLLVHKMNIINWILLISVLRVHVKKNSLQSGADVVYDQGGHVKFEKKKKFSRYI